ncbi:hypothetical protein Nepgr_026575 [Nepenthes gracilis]|uniref:Uncharacterized protein n=1 Tax=Nepenthes gracilis TaxID=150966 RepID=A0AAD3Y0I0_NEPGR|nr:hypothetical protein Nepgr_026575 [Nepenthes gracilis]
MLVFVAPISPRISWHLRLVALSPFHSADLASCASTLLLLWWCNRLLYGLLHTSRTACCLVCRNVQRTVGKAFGLFVAHNRIALCLLGVDCWFGSIDWIRNLDWHDTVGGMLCPVCNNKPVLVFCPWWVVHSVSSQETSMGGLHFIWLNRPVWKLVRLLDLFPGLALDGWQIGTE